MFSLHNSWLEHISYSLSHFKFTAAYLVACCLHARNTHPTLFQTLNLQQTAQKELRSKQLWAGAEPAGVKGQISIKNSYWQRGAKRPKVNSSPRLLPVSGLYINSPAASFLLLRWPAQPFLWQHNDLCLCVCVCWLIVLTNLPLRPSNPTQSFLLWKALPFEWGDVCLYKLWAKWLLDYILPSVQLKRSSFSLILKLCWIHIFIKYQMIKLLFILLEVYNPESIVTVLNRYAQNEFRTKKKKIQARTYLKHWIRNYKHLHRGVQMSAVRSRSVCVVVVVLLRISVPAAQVSYHGAYQLFKGEQELFSQPALRSYLHFHSVVWVWFMIWVLCSTGLQAVQKAPMAHLVCLKSKDYFVLHLKCLWEHSAAFFLIVSNRQSNNSTH